MVDWVEVSGYLASGLVFLTFCMKTLIPLRIVAMLSNVAFIVYGIAADLKPVLVLHATLLPLNVLRTMQQIELRDRVRAAARRDISVDVLLRFMERRLCDEGEVIFRKGDFADFLFYLASGRIELEETGVTVDAGNVVGEIGVFVHDGLRTATVRCLEPSEIFVLPKERAEHLFYQNPEFGFYMIRLVTRRLVENQRTLEARLVELQARERQAS
jgi:CRP-like cAMP-binding protein